MGKYSGASAKLERLEVEKDKQGDLESRDLIKGYK